MGANVEFGAPAEFEFGEVPSDADLDAIEIEASQFVDPLGTASVQPQRVADGAPPAGPQPVSAAPPVAQPPPVVAPQPPVVAAVAAPSVASQPEPVGQRMPELDAPSDFAAAWEAGREGLIDRLASDQFALSAQEVEALGLVPDSAPVLSRMMAKALWQSIAATQKILAAQLPVMMTSHLQTYATRKEAQDQFFSRWPHLRDPQHMDTVQRFTKTYRQMNPQVPLSQAIEEIGLMATQHLKLTPQVQQAAAPQRPAQLAHAPAQGRVVAAAPFVPAAASGGVPGGSPAVSDDPWAGAFLDLG